MKKFIAALAFTAIIASPSFAATKKTKKTTTTTTTTTPAVDNTTYTSTHASYQKSPIWSVSFGVGSVASKFGFGPMLKAQWPVDLQGNDFKFGGRTGFLFGPSTPTSFSIPVLVTAEYDIRTSNALKPYIGLEMGIAFSHASVGDTTIGGVTISGGSASSTDFAFFFVPGLEFGEGHLYFVELPLGVVASNFTILPSIGMHF
jgi:opacity protein-like surface antigen